ncbi:MAG: transposase, partial [Pseudomonadota bacterium]|nr:transposase [Pseudomonadota bacterium]
MELATLIENHREAFEAQYADRLLPAHLHALDAISRCRTPAAGEVIARCTDCGQTQWHPCSCGHRSCPKCQNHEVTQWLERQREKLLPVDYFLVTFTLPAELRPLAWSHQRTLYSALFSAASQTLKQFGLDPKHLGAEIGMTAVLHTHSRRLTYHPHLHVVVPGGGVDVKHGRWKRTRYQYLFNQTALAKVFRGKFLHEIAKDGLSVPAAVPKQWVVDCRHAGRGEPALEYLSRYLYRGVIGESNILCDRDARVSFRYIDGETGESRTETLPGEAFLWRIVQHVLPRGF